MAVAATSQLINTITDFLARNPTPQAIIDYGLPESLEQRALELLDLNRQNRLSDADRAEMEEFMRMEQFMTILKAKSRLQLKNTP
jgi:hypothetical protein